jgi:RNA polymerase sigma-70 factor (ECF subfamily)
MIDPALETRIHGGIAAGTHESAVSEALRGYGPRIAAYIRTLVRDEEAAQEVFAQFCERLWKSIANFRGHSSFLTWAYSIAWHTFQHYLANPYERRRERLDTGVLANLVGEVYSSATGGETSALLSTLEALRRTLSPLEQSLLTLRIDQELSWREVALVLGDERLDETALRKRYERLRARIRKELAARGYPGP